MGQSTHRIIENETNEILQYQHSFHVVDINTTCFDLSLGLLQACMKQ
jgi:hypothetical protein